MVLNKLTGAELFSGGGPDLAGYASPVIATINGKKQYVIFEGKALIGVDPDKGGPPLWRCPWTTTQYGINIASPIVVDDSDIFVTSGYGVGCGLIKVNGGKAAPAWTNKEIKAQFNTPVLVNGQIYGIGDVSGLVCLDPKTGVSSWKQAGFEKGGLMALIDGVLIAMNWLAAGDCVMVEASPEKYKELGRIKPLGGQSWTAPIVADLKLIIRNKAKLGCYDLKVSRNHFAKSCGQRGLLALKNFYSATQAGVCHQRVEDRLSATARLIFTLSCTNVAFCR